MKHLMKRSLNLLPWLTFTLFLLVLIVFCLIESSASPALAQTISSKKPFLVFDGTLYRNKPDLGEYGIQPITIVYAGQFGNKWKKYVQKPLPSELAVQDIARKAKTQGNLIALDIEHWPLVGTPVLVEENLAKYLSVLEWFRKDAPNLPIGYYGLPIGRDYWRGIKDSSSQQYRDWMYENDQTRPIAIAVDIFFPSLYTFYADQTGWKQYALAQIKETRRYGLDKPIYVFLWPQYHDSNAAIGGQYLSEDFWLLELETAREHADGIVIWGGWGSNNKPAQWDENAPWWKVTKEFMKDIDQSVPSAPNGLTVR